MEVFWSSLLPLTTSQKCFMLLFLDASSSVVEQKVPHPSMSWVRVPPCVPTAWFQGFVSDRINLPEEVLAAKSSVCNHNIRLDEEVARLLPAPQQVNWERLGVHLWRCRPDAVTIKDNVALRGRSAQLQFGSNAASTKQNRWNIVTTYFDFAL